MHEYFNPFFFDSFLSLGSKMQHANFKMQLTLYIFFRLSQFSPAKTNEVFELLPSRLLLRGGVLMIFVMLHGVAAK